MKTLYITCTNKGKCYIADNKYEQPFYESEDCEECLESNEENNIEYTQECTWNGSLWVCDQCGQSM